MSVPEYQDRKLGREISSLDLKKLTGKSVIITGG
jgi:hypothetical protein